MMYTLIHTTHRQRKMLTQRTPLFFLPLNILLNNEVTPPIPPRVTQTHLPYPLESQY